MTRTPCNVRATPQTTAWNWAWKSILAFESVVWQQNVESRSTYLLFLALSTTFHTHPERIQAATEVNDQFLTPSQKKKKKNQDEVAYRMATVLDCITYNKCPILSASCSYWSTYCEPLWHLPCSSCYETEFFFLRDKDIDHSQKAWNTHT